jgi:cytochrome c oxidase assembly factor CtaG
VGITNYPARPPSRKVWGMLAKLLRPAAALAGLAALLAGGLGLHEGVASMASGTLAMMTLNQIAPPLLLLGLPRGALARWAGHGVADVALGIALNPFVTMTLFIGLSIFFFLPSDFPRALFDPVLAPRCGLLALLSGLMLWAQIVPATRRVKADWIVGSLAWFGAMPMTAVALIWMLEPHPVYVPYRHPGFRWETLLDQPLADQHWAGLAMLLAGLPLQFVGVWLIAGLGRGASCKG